MLIVLYKVGPFMIFRHRDWASPQLIDGFVCILGFAAQDADVSVVSFLDLTYDDRFELASRAFQVEVRLSGGQCT